MAPLMNDAAPHPNNQPPPSPRTDPKARLLIIGAGSRGCHYARAVVDSGVGTIVAVAEPSPFKRNLFGTKYIWPNREPTSHESFSSFSQYVSYELHRRTLSPLSPTPIDGVFICVRDEQHVEAITTLAPLNLHILSEKPLATTLSGCLQIQSSLHLTSPRIFAIGHVLRYSPHNMLLRHLLLTQRAIGTILSIEHTEPVGWSHFSHSYVRGSWRKESTSAPSLLTKSCHDIDFLLWLLCSPPPSNPKAAPHLPARISSAGSLKQFRRARKPLAAGAATNCLECPLQQTCAFSAPRLYNERFLRKGHTAWPIDVVNPEIETLYATVGKEEAERALMRTLREDYEVGTTPRETVEGRAWYGRCVWESDNDVCDDQLVTIEWDDDEGEEEEGGGRSGEGVREERGAKTASFHMIAQTLAQCERRGRVYGTEGEVEYDSTTITVHSFTKDTTEKFEAEVPKGSHHGGGDDGLTQQFIKAILACKAGREVGEAQEEFLGCSIEEVLRSHAMVFAAEEARRGRKVVEWGEWWRENVEAKLGRDGGLR